MTPFFKFTICSLIWVCLPGMVSAQPGKGPVPVETINVLEVEHAGEKTFVGSLIPIQSVVVGSAVDGRVENVFFNAGDPVGAMPAGSGESSSTTAFHGEAILQLRTGTLDIEIGLAEIKVKQSQQALGELKIAIPSDIKVANSILLQANSAYEFANTDYQMSDRLRNQSGAVSELELQQSRSKYLAAKQAVTTAELLMEKLNSTKEVRTAQAQLQLDADHQELLRLKDMRAKYTIRAPFDGVVTEKLTEVGAWLTRGSAVAKIVKLDQIELVVNIPQEYVSDLQTTLGNEVAVKFEGIEQVLTGRVERVVPQADLRSRSFPVRLLIENPKAANHTFLLQPGMLGIATMAIGEPKQMTLVKKDALVWDGGRSTLFKLDFSSGAPKVVAVSVRVGVAVGDWFQVSGDINESDEVVLLGNEQLRSGQEVKINKKHTGQIDLSTGS